VTIFSFVFVCNIFEVIPGPDAGDGAHGAPGLPGPLLFVFIFMGINPGPLPSSSNMSPPNVPILIHHPRRSSLISTCW
jgi:hypothetical protein